MAVDPQVQALLDMMAAGGAPPLSDATLADTRAGFAMLLALTAGPGPDVGVEVRAIPGPHGDIPLRVYRPAGATDVGPGVVFIHGGGWTIGSAQAYDPIAKHVAAGTAATVVSVDYRLAPEHPFPVPFDECWAALGWTAANAGELGIDEHRIAVMGDSAGGNLAAVLAQRAATEGAPALALQALVYPVTACDLDTASYHENASGFFLERATMEYFWRAYTSGGADPLDPRLSPLRAADLRGVAPAIVITAELDPLRDEGEAYAEALRRAGVAVEHARYDGMIHGFLMMPAAIDAGQRAIDQVAAALRRAFGTLG
jgi:acetyl esterase